MRERLQARLEELKTEYGKGKATLEELESKISSVRSTMLRISGAIQVLEEELKHAGASSAAPTDAQGPSESANGQAPTVPSLSVSA